MIESNAYQTDLTKKVDFVDEVERWKIRWALVDDKPETLLDTLHEANRDLHSIISIILTMPEIFQYNETSKIILKVDHER